ncbi:MAG: hypothetical protein A3F72_02905 [Bacteroidetes bacterium RIFCSPLOWO2_12_FULL_35_15]|nr:MAG: hypothetical protein A3F72_02905 [Bacteroidetes bacterium RIFCSPLOWO2_12_FULL_35_15]
MADTVDIEIVNNIEIAVDLVMEKALVATGGGTVNVFLNGVLQGSVISSALDAEVVNINW